VEEVEYTLERAAEILKISDYAVSAIGWERIHLGEIYYNG
jgi:hypothetical protein